ncbi:nucleotide sugar dehydrogenase [Anditalea andensis]|uniref:UDP-N-acetyl-D-galactosamine dehydrogenase n=1 Tax=Anditalea andensis TaxID=1048983 RepID=A0A074LI32_9BACT|nr:nucleotide sugar dehydrogenase [Anditalea andensis]KEO73452.1 UDP-N-acetyl-D-galactosamine dehydrogenase [Anditalea andensis]
MQNHIAVIGLGYVGLPLAVEFSKKFSVIGFDINIKRVGELNKGNDSTMEVEDENLKSVLVDSANKLGEGRHGLYCTTVVADIADANIYIITVPTPTDKHNRPDLTPLIKSSKSVGKVLKKGDIVIYESTVYPGVTEEECVPILEEASGLKFNVDFFAGYSPERINPGDKEHTVTKILKVTSGSTPEVADKVDELYRSIIVAGTHKAPSIKVAEAAKVIENAQRDINIAFVNELAKIFTRMGIDTREVLEAAGTKWNFLNFSPGLVGGHCIGVDPYYLAQRAQEFGYHPEIILAGRRLNDGMGAFVAKEVVKLMLKNKVTVLNAKILILGFTFKENCPDVRNTRVIDIYHELLDYDADICVYDPWASKEEVAHEYNLNIANNKDQLETYDAIILAVAHKEFYELDMDKLSNKNSVIYDIKGFLPKEKVTARL